MLVPRAQHLCTLTPHPAARFSLCFQPFLLLSRWLFTQGSRRLGVVWKSQQVRALPNPPPSDRKPNRWPPSTSANQPGRWVKTKMGPW